MSDDEIREIDIHGILPQVEPFVMVGRLVHYDEVVTRTETVVEEGNLFVEDGCFSASGLIENIAQTCAARIGYINKYILKRGVEIGYIGAIRGLNIERLPLVGERICTEIEVVEDVFGMTLVNACVVCGEETVARAEMKVVVRRMEGGDGL